MASTEDIAACGAKGFVLVKLKRILAQLLPDKVRVIVRTNNVEVVSSLLFTMANILALGISSYLFIQGTITLGSVYVIFKYTEMLRSPGGTDGYANPGIFKSEKLYYAHM